MQNETQDQKLSVVFLDRGSLDARLPTLNFDHQWTEYSSTPHSEIVQRLKDADIAITNKIPISRETIEQLPDLKFIGVAATGTNIIDIEACRERQITVSNIPEYARSSVPEHTFALILALRRQLKAYTEDVRQGAWNTSEQFCLLNHPVRDLAGSRLGVIGYGTLGKAVAQLGLAFGMELYVYNRSPIDDPRAVQAPLSEVLETSDVVTLHLPLNEQTRNMIAAPQLTAMKRSAVLVNTSRGGLVHEMDLAHALTHGVIAGAGFDVLTSEPPKQGNPLLDLDLPNFLLTPHVAWASQEAMASLATQLVANVHAFVSGRPQNCVS